MVGLLVGWKDVWWDGRMYDVYDGIVRCMVGCMGMVGCMVGW
jgi:hypothetical protein